MSKKTVLISCTSLILALLVILITGVSTAWFGTRRTIGGEVNLSPGIRVDFNSTILYENGEFWLLKYDVNSINELSSLTNKSKLEIDQARAGDSFYVVNPVLTSMTSDDFYLRARFVYKEQNGNILSESEISEIFTSTIPIEFSDNWLSDNTGNWYYFVKNDVTSWTGNIPNEENLKLVEKFDNISFLKYQVNNEIDYISLTLKSNDIEHFPIESVEIILQLQAVEKSKVNEQFFS